MLTTLCNRWWVVLLRGLIAIAAGIVAMMHPGLTVWLLVMLVGINALLEGMTCVFLGFGGGPDGKTLWEMVVLGLIGVGFGIATLAWPGATAYMLLVLIASWALARGVFEIVVAWRLRHVIDDEWWLILAGVISVAFGALLLMRPAAGLLAMGQVIGVFLFVFGCMATAFALRLQSLRGRLKSHGG